MPAMDRMTWLNTCADYYVRYGKLPRLPLPDEPGHMGCEMIMAATIGNRIEFEACYPDVNLVCYREKPKPKKKGALEASDAAHDES